MDREEGDSAAPANGEAHELPILITEQMLAGPPKGRGNGRVDFERGMSAAPAVPLLLIAACVLAFALELGQGALRDAESVVAAGALVRARVLAGEPWRLISAIFLHGSVDHLLGNCFALYILGMACEHAYGRAKVLVLYALGGLCGSLLSMLVNPGPSLGASGAIFGLQGAMVMFFYQHRGSFYLCDRRIGFVLLAWGVYTIMLGFLTPYVDNLAHLGGAIGGAAAAYMLEPRLIRQAVAAEAR
jgi:rhomboid protease GluP